MSELESIGRRMDAIVERLEHVASGKRTLAALLRGRAKAKRDAAAVRAESPAAAAFVDSYCGPEPARSLPEVDEARAKLLELEAAQDEAAVRESQAAPEAITAEGQ